MPTLLVVGTASHAGKSIVAARLCRLFDDRGLPIVPFKVQGMSNNARAVATADGDGFGGVGVSQYVQVHATRVTLTTDHNPVLLKSHGDGASRLVVHDWAADLNTVSDYHVIHWEDARKAVVESHRRLASRVGVAVAEGAGSTAEINPHDHDLANIETARFSDADVLLAVDIECDGVFASLLGTFELLPEDARDRVIGAVITKFRGGLSLLKPGIDAIEERTGVPVLGVFPHDDSGLPGEDSLMLSVADERAITGDDDGVTAEYAATIGIPRLPRISNATGSSLLSETPGVRVAYLLLDAAFDGVNGVVLPGSKNTVDGPLALRGAGFDGEFAGFDGPVVGICGGYQLSDKRIESTNTKGLEDDEMAAGLGLLPIIMRFSHDKRAEPVSVEFDGTGSLAGATGTADGYETHMGDSRIVGGATSASDNDVTLGNAAGTYIRDPFANNALWNAFMDAIYKLAGRDRPATTAGMAGTNVNADESGVGDPYDRAAILVTGNLDVMTLYDSLGLEEQGSVEMTSQPISDRPPIRRRRA